MDHKILFAPYPDAAMMADIYLSRVGSGFPLNFQLAPNPYPGVFHGQAWHLHQTYMLNLFSSHYIFFFSLSLWTFTNRTLKSFPLRPFLWQNVFNIKFSVQCSVEKITVNRCGFYGCADLTIPTQLTVQLIWHSCEKEGYHPADNISERIFHFLITLKE